MNGSIKKEMLFFKEQGFFETPKICQIEITTVCPLKCPQCYKSLTPKHANFEALCKRLEEAKKAGVGSIMINGGEPMMHPYFLKLISYISDKLLSKSTLGISFFTSQSSLSIYPRFLA